MEVVAGYWNNVEISGGWESFSKCGLLKPIGSRFGGNIIWLWKAEHMG
jgi:hypothetical protein